MNLLKSIEEDEKKLAELEGSEVEDTVPTEPTEEERDEDHEDDQPDDGGTKDGEKPQEEAKADEEKGDEKPEVKPDPKEEASAASFAKLRKTLRETERQLADERAAKAKPVEEKKPAPKADEPDPEPNKAESYEAWLEWKDRQHEKQLAEIREWKDNKDKEDTKRKEEETQARTLYEAVQEFEGYQEEYRKVNPDYDNAAQFVRAKMVDSLKALNPGMNDKDATQRVARLLLAEAGRLYNEGKDPAEGLYEMALSHWGYRKAEPVKEAPVETKDTPKKPDLKAIDANRKRSASSLKGGSGDASIPLTKEAAVKMTSGEFAKLTPEQLMQLEQMDA